jgi:Cu(I)/Ag(I) efflux system membrane protein CusA/SilA
MTLPLALAGGVWLLYLLGYNMSIAVGVGFIALAGLTVETSLVMLVFLNSAFDEGKETAAGEGRAFKRSDVINAVRDGALLRLRPIIMTDATVIAGLLPIMLGAGAGSEVMRRIAAPMVGGIVSEMILTLVVLPAVFMLWKFAEIRREEMKRTTGGVTPARVRTSPAE